ncbi:MAG: glycosyltransferase [Bifidobacteriaceae bacterium]|nr:glycosyltransferase [Bifidobacteriaceae bacterium]
MPGNNALIDARVMKNLRTAAALGYDAVALGISRGEGVRDEELPTGGRVMIQPVPPRRENRWRYGRPHVFFDRTERSDGRAYAAHLREGLGFERGRALRDTGRRPLVSAPRRPSAVRPAWRRLRYLAVRVIVKVRSLRADREIERDTWHPAKLEAWRGRRFAGLKATPWRARWRRALPQATDQALALAGRLHELAPDIIHVHDVYMMHVASQYASRAALRGRGVRLVYDAREFVPGLAHVPPVRVTAYANMEREFMGDFDRVVTVSDLLADWLVARHGLSRRPDLVLNAPMRYAGPDAVPNLRQVAGVAPDAPLVVYSGGVNPARGLGTVVEALTSLPGVHLAVVTNNRGQAVRHLESEAERLGVGDQVHLAPFVPHDQVTRYLASADVGVTPLSRAPNHDIALTNKFCEYIEAGLPVVTSDTPQQAALVRDLGLGAVFEAEDAPGLALALRQVLDDLPALKARIAGDAELQRRFSWDAQAEVLARVYAEEVAALGLEPPDGPGPRARP